MQRVKSSIPAGRASPKTRRPKLKVGASLERTATKHKALNKFCGQIAGAASQIPNISNVIFIDACAGNGQPNPFSNDSSPEIFARHIKWLVEHGKPVRGYLIESDDETFAQLQNAIQVIAEKLGWPGLADKLTLIEGDYRRPEVAAQLKELTSKSTAFVFIDPNSANQVELSATLQAVLPNLSTWLVTLGCNVGGNKRAVLAERQKWFDRLKDLLACVQPYQDACLIRLKQDASQWAYLISVPRQWRDKTETAIRSLQKEWSKGVSHYWQSDGTLLPAAQELFLTKAEIDAIHQPTLPFL